MENKEELINKLLKEGKINFKEACVLMDMESNANISFNKFEDYAIANKIAYIPKRTMGPYCLGDNSVIC